MSLEIFYLALSFLVLKTGDYKGYKSKEIFNESTIPKSDLFSS